MEKINKIKIPEGVESISVTQHDDKIVLEFIPEKSKFNRGDILISTVNSGLTVIFDKMTPVGFDSIYNSYSISNNAWGVKAFRHATKEEKQEFFDKLKADGKQWDDEELKIKDIPVFKEGDFIYQEDRVMIVHKYPHFYKALVFPSLSTKVYYNSRYGLTFSSPSFRFATEEEKQFLLDALEKDGKKWNAEKLIVEDIPKRKFKLGDKVTLKSGYTSKSNLIYRSVFDEYIGKELIVIDYTEDGNVKCNSSFYFAEDWLEPYVEELKEGDLAIFWDDATLYPLIRLYHAKQHNGNKHCDNFGAVWDNAVKWDGTKEQFEKVSRG